MRGMERIIPGQYETTLFHTEQLKKSYKPPKNNPKTRFPKWQVNQVKWAVIPVARAVTGVKNERLWGEDKLIQGMGTHVEKKFIVALVRRININAESGFVIVKKSFPYDEPNPGSDVIKNLATEFGVSPPEKPLHRMMPGEVQGI
jgi:hypothetical protein